MAGEDTPQHMDIGVHSIIKNERRTLEQMKTSAPNTCRSIRYINTASLWLPDTRRIVFSILSFTVNYHSRSLLEMKVKSLGLGFIHLSFFEAKEVQARVKSRLFNQVPDKNYSELPMAGGC